ncbi:MAG: FtsX-like permease family protein [Acidobacteriota bacterium]
MSASPPESAAQAPPRRTLLLRRLPLVWSLAWRYLRGRRSEVLSSTALAALFSTSLGVTAMVVALALMTGYTQDLQRRLIGLQGEIVASPLGSEEFDQVDAVLEAAALPGIERWGRVSYGEGSLSSPSLPDGASIVLRGIEEGSVPPLLDADGVPTRRDAALEPDERGVPGVLLGQELQRRLGVAEGDVLRLVVLRQAGDQVGFRYRSVRCAGTFTTGFAEFDAQWALVDRQMLASARGAEGLDVLELDVAESADAAEAARWVEEVLGPTWLVQRWETMNRDLFAALALQKVLLFFVLGLIVVVSTFNVSSTLVILVRERKADIGVLSSLGLRPRQLWALFVVYGLGLGVVGTALGVAVGAGLSWLVTEFELVRFDPEVAAIYFIDSVPFRVELGDVAAVVAFALVVTAAASALPALRAARLDPADALRDE